MAEHHDASIGIGQLQDRLANGLDLLPLNQLIIRSKLNGGEAAKVV